MQLEAERRRIEERLHVVGAGLGNKLASRAEYDRIIAESEQVCLIDLLFTLLWGNKIRPTPDSCDASLTGFVAVGSNVGS